MPTHTEGSPAARLCIVDADPQTRSGFDDIAREEQADLSLYQSPSELRRRIPLSDVHALVIDVDGDWATSRELQCDLLQQNPCAPVIATTVDRRSEAAVESLQLGAMDVLERPWNNESMRASIQLALWQAQRERKQAQTHASVQNTLSQLTQRQHRVLELAAVGMPNKSIAATIDVSQRTVEAEKSKLLTIFNASSYPELMVKLGEFRVLEQLRETRQRLTDHRLARVAGFSARQIVASDTASFGHRFGMSDA